ncbi:glycoside hydrolase family 36 protein [Bifidobacterium gallicum]|nr:glycoside hydrolase family 36 protein [Bifidobacterium gallicum]KFI59393.1 putative alpha-galactosidase [Bifidobacterium gallicum DSM 20093 = LMG 11596]
MNPSEQCATSASRENREDVSSNSTIQEPTREPIQEPFVSTIPANPTHVRGMRDRHTCAGPIDNPPALGLLGEDYASVPGSASWDGLAEIDAIIASVCNGCTRIEPDGDGRFTWGNGVTSLTFQVSDESPVSLVGISGRGMADAADLVAPVPQADTSLDMFPTHSGESLRNPGNSGNSGNSEDSAAGARDTAGQSGSDTADTAATADQPFTGEPDPQPIVVMRSSRDSGADSRLKLAVSAAGRRLRFRGAFALAPGQLNRAGSKVVDGDADRQPATLVIVQHDELGEVPVVASIFQIEEGLSAVRTYTLAHSKNKYPLEALSSMNMTLPLAACDVQPEDMTIYYGDSSWDLENDWHSSPLRSTTLKDRNYQANPGMGSARFSRSSSSTWSTGEFLPAGIIEATRLTDGSHPFSFMWQIETNGAWEWAVGEDAPGLRVSAYGPECHEHSWFTMLDDTNVFRSVPVSFAICEGDWRDVVAEMTMQRRALRRAQAAYCGRVDEHAHEQGVVVYNDYQDTLNGDPSVDKELPLISGAAKAGADIFCIDAGWYDSEDLGWWSTVGEWMPSTNRFGALRFAGVTHTIQANGMRVGLWVEPEIVGVNSPAARMLPDSAFMCRHGERVGDRGRYHLDFRSPLAREHATLAIERLVHEFDVRYFKFAYNTTPGMGPDTNAESMGSALLDHCRAVLDWVDSIRVRHPDVIIENSSSGSMRADYAILSRLDMQSTSDQCDPVVFASIAAASGLTVLPEQQGHWVRPDAAMDDEQAVFVLATGILSRMILTGFLDQLDEPRMNLVREAIGLHRAVLDEQRAMVPWYPYELPDFNGAWLVAGLKHDERIAHDTDPELAARIAAGETCDYLTIWRRHGVESMYLELPADAHLEQVFPDPAQHQHHAPGAKPWTVEREDSTTVRITASRNDVPSARVFKVVYDRQPIR